MLLGMLPGLLVFALLATAWLTLVWQVGDLVSWATPFADDWVAWLRGLVRLLLGLALLVGSVLLFTAVFTGLTLTVGDPFYERIWQSVESELGGPVPTVEVGFWRSAVDGLRLAAAGLLASLLVLLSGFVPVAGPVLGITLGVLLAGRLLGRELVSRPLAGRGLDAAAQRALLAPYRGRVLGFGVAVQLCFLVPLGGVLVMPAAVAGATALVRDVLDDHARLTG